MLSSDLEQKVPNRSFDEVFINTWIDLVIANRDFEPNLGLSHARLIQRLDINNCNSHRLFLDRKEISGKLVLMFLVHFLTYSISQKVTQGS